MKKTFMTKSFILSTCFLVFAFTSCDDFKKETYKISDIDNQAKTVFQTSTPVVRTAATIVEGVDTLVTPVDSCFYLTVGGVKMKLDDNEASTISDSLVLKNAVIAPDTMIYRFITPSALNSSYYVLDVPEDGDYYIYLNEYVKVKLTGVSGVEEDADESVPLELTANFFTISDNKPVPVVKARYAFELTEGKYLLELITTDQTISRTFNIVVLED
ncbi:MAG: hypothetical protein WC602_00310 [archaeon]